MLEIEYLTNPDESAQATIDFFKSRPLMAMLVWCMQAFCIIYVLAFAIGAIYRTLRLQDYMVGGLVLAWFFAYEHLSRWIIKRKLLVKQMTHLKCLLKMDSKSILYQIQGYTPQYIELKKIRYILRTARGYIIPLTGLQNAGKFMWVPNRSLPTNGQFTALLDQFQVSIKTIKS